MAESSGLSNLKISNQVIIFNPQSQSAELTLTNVHQAYHIYFKIKTKIQRIFDVKPVTGCIKPGDKVVIHFKAANPINESQYQNLEQKLQFLIQGVNSTKQEMSKEEEELFWKVLKTNKQHMELGYMSEKLHIKFSSQEPEESEYLPRFNQFQSKVNSNFSSNVKSDSGKLSVHPPLSHAKGFSFGGSEEKIQKVQRSDEELSKQYEALKEKEEKLVREREKVFQTPGSSSSGNKKKSSNIMVIVVFVIMFFVGNFLQTFFKAEEVQPEEKGFFESIF